MYINVISFSNGKVLTVDTLVPFSVDKLDSKWILITDNSNGQTVSFKASEVVTISSAKIIERKTEKKRGLKTKVTE